MVKIKNKKTIILVFLILTSFIILNNINTCLCKVEQEDFESGNLATTLFLNVRELGATVETTQPYEGSYSLECFDDSTSLSNMAYSNNGTFFDYSGIETLSAWLYISPTGYTLMVLNIYVISCTGSNGYLRAYGGIYSDGKALINGNVFYSNIQNDTWYLYTEILDWTNTKINVTLYDDTLTELASYNNVVMSNINIGSAYRDVLIVTGGSTKGYGYVDFVNTPIQSLILDSFSCNFISVLQNTTELTDICNFTSLWQTNGTLNYYIFSWNFTESWVNDTEQYFSGSTTGINLKDLTDNITKYEYIINYEIFAVSDTGVWNSSGIQTFNLSYEPLDSNIISYIILGSIISSFIIFLVIDKKFKKR